MSIFVRMRIRLWFDAGLFLVAHFVCLGFAGGLFSLFLGILLGLEESFFLGRFLELNLLLGVKSLLFQLLLSRSGGFGAEVLQFLLFFC